MKKSPEEGKKLEIEQKSILPVAEVLQKNPRNIYIIEVVNKISRSSAGEKKKNNNKFTGIF